MQEHVVRTRFVLDKPHPKSGNIYTSENIKGLLGEESFQDRLHSNRIYGSVGGKELIKEMITYDKVTHVVKNVFVTPDNEVAVLIRTLNKPSGDYLDKKLTEEPDRYIAQFVIMGSQDENKVVTIEDIRHIHIQRIRKNKT